MEEVISNLLNVILHRLVSNPDALKITTEYCEQTDVTIYTIHADKKDMGRIIGKNGRIIRSIKVIALSAAIKNHLRISVQLERV